MPSSASWPVPEGETPPPRVEASLVIGHYTIVTLDPGPSKHPNYLNLVSLLARIKLIRQVQYDDSIVADEEANYMLQMEFLKKPKKPSETLSPQAQEKLGSYGKEMALNLRNCKIVFDKEVWERVYAFLLSGGRGKRFAKYDYCV